MTSFEWFTGPRREEVRPPGETYLDYGPSLPEKYGRDAVGLLVRDPECIFGYWEGGETLRMVDLTAGSDRSFNVSTVGTLFLHADPDHEYEGELLRGGVVVARSNRVRTPRRGPATEMDPEWILTPAQQEEFKRLSGVVGLQVGRPSSMMGRV